MVRVILPAFLGLVLLVTVVVLVTATVTSRRPRTGGAHGVPAPISRRPVPPPVVAAPIPEQRAELDHDAAVVDLTASEPLTDARLADAGPGEAAAS